jgi:hypothetical protein
LRDCRTRIPWRRSRPDMAAALRWPTALRPGNSQAILAACRRDGEYGHQPRDGAQHGWIPCSPAWSLMARAWSRKWFRTPQSVGTRTSGCESTLEVRTGGGWMRGCRRSSL